MKNKRDEVFQFTKLQPTCKTEGFLGNLHGTMKNASLNFSQYDILALKKLLVRRVSRRKQSFAINWRGTKKFVQVENSPPCRITFLMVDTFKV